MRRHSTSWIRWSMVLLTLVGSLAVEAQGCFNCVYNYNDCAFPAGVCSNRCDQVGHNETGDAIYCTEVEVFPGAGGQECYMTGGACLNTDVIDQEPGTCPDGQVCRTAGGG